MLLDIRWIARLGALLVAIGAFSVMSHAEDEFSQQNMLSAVNAIREQHNVAQLQPHPQLQEMARKQSRLMARFGKMSHKVIWFNGFQARLRRAGYRGLAAENIAEGQQTLQKVLQTWMNSPGHRRNMLHPRMRYFGMALAKGKGRNYWTLVLGG